MSVQTLQGRLRTAELSRLARTAAGRSSELSGFPVMVFEKEEHSGAPKPAGGIYWSVSHKPGAVGGVVSKRHVGIDIEKIKTVSSALYKKIVTPEEQLLFFSSSGPPGAHSPDAVIFFRVFTAKEAVLKKIGIGIKGLSRAKVVRVTGTTGLIVQYQERKYPVEHFYIDDYIASVTKDLFDVQWTIV